MIKIDWKNEQTNSSEEPLKIDFSKIIVPEETTSVPSAQVPTSYSYNSTETHITDGSVFFGSVAEAYKKDEVSKTYTNTYAYNDANSNVTYLSTNPLFTAKAEPEPNILAGNVFAKTISVSTPDHTTGTKGTVTELQRIVQKLEKLEKMINPNSKKSLILWEEDNSFKNLISSVVTFANNCDLDTEFPIELYDKLKALSEDIDKQLEDGKTKIEELNRQAQENTELSAVLSKAYISATAGLSSDEYESKLNCKELEEYKAKLETIATCDSSSEAYQEAEKAIKSKISNLENSVHITIDLERTTSKSGALNYIKTETAPAVTRLKEAYDRLYKTETATTIDESEAITSLIVKRSLAERVYDTFVRPFANLFRRKKKVK
jgi:hypothetical protein